MISIMTCHSLSLLMRKLVVRARGGAAQEHAGENPRNFGYVCPGEIGQRGICNIFPETQEFERDPREHDVLRPSCFDQPIDAIRIFRDLPARLLSEPMQV